MVACDKKYVCIFDTVIMLNYIILVTHIVHTQIVKDDTLSQNRGFSMHAIRE